MRTLKMLSVNTSKRYIFSILFGIYISALLWITLFSRIGTDSRGFFYPFQSYVEIFQGDWGWIVENIENVVLFIPLGIAVRSVKKWNWYKVLICGLCASLCIELVQLIFGLGNFEFDDLMHNTLGTMIGFWIIRKTRFNVDIGRGQIIACLASICICVAIPFGYQGLHYQHMVSLAAQYDKADETKNLLVLNGKDGYAWDTDVYLKYQSDGSISIKGTSDKTAWWPIADIELDAGTYVFSGLSGVEENTVGLEIETDNHRYAPDVGPNKEVKFEVSQHTKFKVYVIVYDGCACDVTARPVIYKEE